MKIEIPKILLEPSDISRLHNLLGMAWRDDGAEHSNTEDSPNKRYALLANETGKAATEIAQLAFETGMKYQANLERVKKYE